MHYETILATEGNLPRAFCYDGTQQNGTASIYLGRTLKDADSLTIQTGSYFTRKEVMELAMVLLRISNQMVDWSN